MSKKNVLKKDKPKKRKRPVFKSLFPSENGQMQDMGEVRFPVPDPALVPEISQKMTENFQNELRKSPFFEKMIEQFGHEEAEKLLKECRTDLRPSFRKES